MKKLFVPYELALILKEKGFNEPCFATYTIIPECEIKEGSLSFYEGLFLPVKDKTFCLAPLYQQVIDWLREKHNITISIYNSSIKSFHFHIINFETANVLTRSEYTYNSYYEALNKAIEEALKLI